MTVTRVYPVLMTDDVPGVAAFWTRHFGFEVTFEDDWYVSLQRDGAELAVLHRDHPTIPEGSRGVSTSGLLVNIELEDVDAEYARASEAGLTVLLPIRSEVFGQRHFIVAGPEGVLGRRHHADRSRPRVRGPVHLNGTDTAQTSSIFIPR